MTADIRVLDRAGIGTLLDWAAAEGWNPGLNDAPAFAAADPKGFLGAFVGERMVAGISVVAYDDGFGFLGLYICHPEFRGQGHGRAVWDAGMARLGARTIGLDGVPAQQDNYRRMGFAAQYETVRMGGRLAPGPAPQAELGPIGPIEEILAFDRSCFPAPRPAFLSHWTRAPHRGVVARRNGAVAGYMVVRACRSGHKVGPLFAADPDVARDLLGTVEGEVQIDVPRRQAGFVALLERQGFAPQFETARMYRGPAPVIALDQVFGVTTLELG